MSSGADPTNRCLSGTLIHSRPIYTPRATKSFWEEGFGHSPQVAATDFQKLREPKAVKLKGGYSSDASLVFQLWVKDIQVYVMECHLSQWEAIQQVKDYTSEHAWFKVEYYLGLTPENKQSFQGLRDHLGLAFQSWETVSSLIGDFYNWSQKARNTKDTFANELQVLVRKIVALKPDFLGEVNQALKHQFAHNLWEPYFRVVARGQCMTSPNSESFTQFWGHLVMMFGSRGKCSKAAHTTSVAVNNEEIGGDTLQSISGKSKA